jgi:hypothetical protein
MANPLPSELMSAGPQIPYIHNVFLVIHLWEFFCEYQLIVCDPSLRLFHKYEIIFSHPSLSIVSQIHNSLLVFLYFVGRASRRNSC